MAKAKKVAQAKTVTEFIEQLEPGLAAMVASLRSLVLSAESQVGEQVKWNSPAFYYTGEMQPFDPKEYKRDIVVMNIHRGYPLLVFPTGATIIDTTGLLEGKYTDGRRIASFKSLEEIDSKGADLQQVIRTWLKQVV
ncbi:MAG: DUF1801 domain-containing protein [Ferruginibacter sp.]|nr:DUF1801 domain-containing protein [Ferruginibacter sp.]